MTTKTNTLIPAFRDILLENPEVEKTNSSYGNYVIRTSSHRMTFFFDKLKADTWLRNYLDLSEDHKMLFHSQSLKDLGQFMESIQ